MSETDVLSFRSSAYFERAAIRRLVADADRAVSFGDVEALLQAFRDLETLVQAVVEEKALNREQIRAIGEDLRAELGPVFARQWERRCIPQRIYDPRALAKEVTGRDLDDPRQRSLAI